MIIKIAGIAENSIVDGDGLRFAIFAQGCEKKCPQCHNPHTHDKNGGTDKDTAEIIAAIKKDPLLSGVTFTGGEPFLQAEAFLEIARNITPLHIIAYSGYTFEELFVKGGTVSELLANIDELVDGEFISEQKSLELRFMGSANQRRINAKESAKLGKAVLL